MTYRKVLLDFDRAKWWLMQGATATQEVQTLLSMAGIMPSPLNQTGHRHLQRFNWGSKQELYQYFLKNRRPAAEMAAEDRYNYYDSADGQHTQAGKRDAEREEARTRVLNQLTTATGIRQQLLGTRVWPPSSFVECIFSHFVIYHPHPHIGATRSGEMARPRWVPSPVSLCQRSRPCCDYGQGILSA